jgi:branched-chain amino acid aminotransferase
MKAYRKDDGKVMLFRPDMNMKRMNTSAQRLALPVRIDYDIQFPCLTFHQSFDGNSLLELIKQLVTLDKHWIPKEPGHSLYIRPTLGCYVPLVQVFPLLMYLHLSWQSEGSWGKPAI